MGFTYKSLMMIVFLTFSLFIVLSVGYCPAAATPAISIKGNNETTVWGVVQNVDPRQYAVIVYAKDSSGLWYGPKPQWNSPFIQINPDLTWECEYYADPSDAYDTDFEAYIIPSSISPKDLKIDGGDSYSESNRNWIAMKTALKK